MWTKLFKGGNAMFNDIRVEFCGIGEMDLKSNADARLKALPRFSLIQPLNGACIVKAESGSEQTCPPGGVILTPPQCAHKILPTDKGEINARFIYLNILIDSSYSAELLYDFPTVIPDLQVQQLNALLNHAFDTADFCDRMSIAYQITKILLSVAKEKSTACGKPLLDALSFINNNYSEKITVSQLASLAGISESNLYASFKRQFGVSPIAYLNDYRLSRASELLKNGDLSIEYIACRVGIGDFRYFSKIFKRKYNSTPSAYRKTVI